MRVGSLTTLNKFTVGLANANRTSTMPVIGLSAGNHKQLHMVYYEILVILYLILQVFHMKQDKLYMLQQVIRGH